MQYGALFSRIRDRLRSRKAFDRVVRVADVQPLSPTLTVYVIDVDRHRFLLAATPHAVSMCARYPVPEATSAKEPAPGTV